MYRKLSMPRKPILQDEKNSFSAESRSSRKRTWSYRRISSASISFCRKTTRRGLEQRKNSLRRKKKMEHTESIELYKAELEKLKEEYEALTMEWTKNKKYLEYLESTCENTGEEFGEPADLQNRHTTLWEKNSELSIRKKESEEEKESAEKEQTKQKKDRDTESQVVSTKYAQMRLTYEELKHKVLSTLTAAEKEDATKMEREHLIGQVVMAVGNTFTRCVNKGNTAQAKKYQEIPHSKVDIFSQLDFISQFYLDLKSIMPHAAEHKKKEEYGQIDAAISGGKNTK